MKKGYGKWIVYRSARGDTIDTYKYLNDNYMVDYTQLLQSHYTRGLETRSNGWKYKRSVVEVI